MSGVNFRVNRLVAVQTSDLDRFVSLLGQLSPSKTIYHDQVREGLQRQIQLDEMARDAVFIAREQKSMCLLGMAAVHLVPRTLDLEARLEDVVVDMEYRRQGIARALVVSCLEWGRQQFAADHAELTSDPTARPEANAMYEKMGFKRRDTHVWRIKLDARP